MSEPKAAIIRHWPAAPLTALLLTGLGSSAAAQTTYTPYHFVTMAGTAGGSGHLDATGAAAQFSSPVGIAVDAGGNVYVADTGNDTIREVTSGGVVTTIVGMAGVAGTTDGPGSTARLSHPTGLAIDRSGNLYVADTANGVIREITPTVSGGITTWTTTTLNATNARVFNLTVYPTGVTIDTSGDLFYTNIVSILPDSSLNEVTSGATTAAEIAGTLGGGYGFRDGIGSNALFDDVSSITIDGNGNIYMADTGNSVIRKVTQATAGGSGTVSVLAGSTAGLGTGGLMSGTAGTPGSADGTQSSALFNQPKGVAVDSSGIAVCEIYDADLIAPTARLVNISARADVGTGNNILIGGFVVGGSTADTVLIRAIGPGLNDLYPTIFPLSAVLNQPVLTILNGSGAVIYSNTVWGGDATLAGVFTTTGAFSLNPAHADSAVLVSLPPGNYTAQVSGLNGGTGIANCEIYEVQ